MHTLTLDIRVKTPKMLMLAVLSCLRVLTLRKKVASYAKNAED